MTLDLYGLVKEVTPIETTQSGQPRCFVRVIEHGGDGARILGLTPKLYYFEAFGEVACQSAQRLMVGKDARISFKISCREWQGRVFTSLIYNGVVADGERWSDVERIHRDGIAADRATDKYIRRRISGLAEYARRTNK